MKNEKKYSCTKIRLGRKYDENEMKNIVIQKIGLQKKIQLVHTKIGLEKKNMRKNETKVQL